MASRILGVSPALTRVGIDRPENRLLLILTTTSEEAGSISFNLVFDRMDVYKLAVAKEDTKGINPIIERLRSRDSRIKSLDYRYDSRYAILDVVLDVDKIIAQRSAEEAKKATPPPKPKPEPPKPEPPKPEPPKPEPPKPKPEPPKPEPPKPKPEPPKPKPEPPKPPPPPPPEPESLMVKKVAKGPIVDGSLSEAAWSQIPPLKLEAKGPGGSTSLMAWGVHDGKDIWLAFSWADQTRDEKHRPWIWSSGKNEYESSSKVEDALGVQFSDRDMSACMTSGREMESDLWMWRAGRTNPGGWAEDDKVLVSTKKLPQANTYQSSSGGTVWIKVVRDEGTLPYRSEIAVTKGAPERPRYLPQTPSGSQADVQARGTWEKGRWSVEMTRKISTGHQDDVPFALRKDFRVSVAIFNADEGSDHMITKVFIMNLE